jgi:hypothetical protein
MVDFKHSDDRDHDIDLDNVPDSLISDNFDDYLARVAIHGTAGGRAEEQKSTPLPRDPIDDMTDRYIPDNFDEIMQRSIRAWRCSEKTSHPTGYE